MRCRAMIIMIPTNIAKDSPTVEAIVTVIGIKSVVDVKGTASGGFVESISDDKSKSGD